MCEYIHVHVQHMLDRQGELEANRAGRARAAAIQPQPAWFNHFGFSELEEQEWMARRLAAIENISLAVILVNYDETVVNYLEHYFNGQ